MDIAATVNPATVHFRSLTEPSRVGVLEQNYEYDLLEPDKLLRKYVGRDVTLVRDARRTAARRARKKCTAQLLSYNNGAGLADRQRDRDRHAAPITSAFPELPGNLYSRPTLIWTLENTGGAPHRVEASYLAGKLPWNADYVLTVGARRQGRRPRRLGDAHQRQRHGVQERDAAARRRRSEPRAPGARNAMARDDGAGSAPAARRADGAGGVLRLPPLHARPEDDDQQQRDQAGQHARRRPASRCQKRYVVDGQAFYYRNAQHPGAPIKDVVQVFYQFKNEEKAGLGMPMPAGIVRVYQADSKGGVQFVGEDRIDHTPKDETLNLKIGNAFDVVCERKQTDFQKIATQRLRSRVRDHAAQPQGDADHRRGERADRRHLAHAAVVARVDEDRRLGRAVHGAGRGGRHGGAEVPRARDLLAFGLQLSALSSQFQLSGWKLATGSSSNSSVTVSISTAGWNGSC